jgi:hypothetical protein
MLLGGLKIMVDPKPHVNANFAYEPWRVEYFNILTIRAKLLDHKNMKRKSYDVVIIKKN